MKFIKLNFFAICFFIVLQQSSAQWNTNNAINNAVCTELSNQQEPRIVTDSKGGAITTWIDSRNDVNNNTDIFVQRIKKNGSVAWTINGIAACSNTSNQTSPFLIEDGKGGAIICWQDLRNGNSDIYAQRFDSTGIAQWAVNGVAVVQKASQQRSQRIVSDGNNGAIIVWEDSINNNSDIFAQRINADGTQAWPANGVAVCTSADLQINLRITNDGNGGAVICWQDKRNSSYYDIYAQKITANGSVSFAQNGIVICSSVNTQNNPKIETDNAGGAYIIWQDKRNALDYNIYAQKINASGAIQFAANGVLVCDYAGNQSAIDATADGITGGIIITWKDGRTPNNHIYAQFLSSTGATQWVNNGLLISNFTNAQLNPNIVGVTNNEAVIVWQDSTANGWDVYTQKINTAGNIQWGTNGVCVSSATANQTSPKNVSDGAGGCVYVWQDKRNANFDIYAYGLKSNGTTTSLENIANTIFKAAIYPNPNNGKFFIGFNDAKELNIIIEIYDYAGKLALLSNFENLNSSFEIDTKLKAGIYFAIIKNIATNQTSNFKLIINE